MFVLVYQHLYKGSIVFFAKEPDWAHHKRMTTILSYAVQFDTPEKAYYMKKHLNKSGTDWKVFEVNPSAWMGVSYSIEGNTKGGV